MQKKIIISVISDLVTDQRVHKVATTLQQNGYDVLVIGAKRKNSKPIENRTYKTERISLLFQKGFLQYAEWNMRLYFKLLFKQKADLYLANDLDTLLPNYLISSFANKKIVYDSHEYFTEQEEVHQRKFVKSIWLKIEKFVFPKLKNVYTVNDSIATIYKEKYNVDVKVVRNMPLAKKEFVKDAFLWSNLNLPQELDEKKILLTQGVGLHTNRGIEELILSMNLLGSDFILLIVGGGLALDHFKALVKNENLVEKVIFIGVLQPSILKQLTAKAFCGFSIDKPTCLNYTYSLPNKLFDFIQASVPVIGSNLPEVAKIINNYKVGIVIDQVTPQLIAAAVMELNNNKILYTDIKQHSLLATKELCWENEAIVLLALINNAT
jgi:glycosyltransferase involved in cell wall biosynthesis